LIVSFDNALTWLVIKPLTFSSTLCNLPVKALFIFYQIFSDGFNSGKYGGIKTSLMFGGITSFKAL